MSDVAKTIGRRLFARATMGMPLVLKGGLGPGNPTPAPPPFLGNMAQAGAAPTGKALLADKIYTAIWQKTKGEQEKRSLAYNRRQMMGGLDPDLAVLNSMSHARRVQIQIDRDQAMEERAKGLRASIIRAMGGNPEEFH